MIVVITSYIAHMFDTTNFDLNNTLIDECKKLIDEHNKLSYVPVSLQMETVLYTYISKSIPKDQLANELISFYEIFTYQMVVAYNLKQIIDSINYTHEDLILHIERSDDTILQLMTSLTGIRLKMMDYHTNILNNISKQTDIFIAYIASESVQNMSAFIDVVFICMLQNNIDQYIKIEPNSKYFIGIGAKIIEKLYYQINKSNLSAYTHSKINDLKQSILSTKTQLYTPFDSINKLQTFNLFPNDGNNMTIKEAMSKLFGLSIDIDDLSNGIQIIETSLKQVSLNQKKKIGIVIITNTNNDTYFDMSSLSTMKQSFQAVGINSEIITKSNLIKSGEKASIKKSELIPINVTTDTDIAYVLWTNNMKQFKIRLDSIDNSIIAKLLRRTPSAIIESYNSILMDTINKLKKYDDAIAFKRVQNMSFNNSVTEESFLQTLKKELEIFIQKEITDRKDKFNEWIIGQGFVETLLDIIDSYKDNLGIHRHMMSAHCQIIYNSMANKIIGKLKRKLLTMNNISEITKLEIQELVNGAIDGNNNIFTRTIASYYLHIA